MKNLILTTAIMGALWTMGCGMEAWEGVGNMDNSVDQSVTPLSAKPFTKGGQHAWFHDEGFSGGFFHTYDAFKVAGPNDQPRKVHVFVPRDYEVSGKRYGVVYMNDGQTAFWPGGAANKSWRVGQTMSTLHDGGKIQDVIIVAIHPLDRNVEYTHESFMWGYGCCGLKGYAGYLANYVKPWIDANYRTLPDARNTTIIGSSHGGLAAFYVAAVYPDKFGNAGCLSPSFWVGLDNPLFNGGPLSSSSLLRATRAGLSRTDHPRFWIDWGLKRDGGEHNSVIEAGATRRGKEMVRLLQDSYGYQVGTSLHWWEDAVGGHDEDAWAYRFGLVMQKFYPAVP